MGFLKLGYRYLVGLYLLCVLCSSFGRLVFSLWLFRVLVVMLNCDMVVSVGLLCSRLEISGEVLIRLLLVMMRELGCLVCNLVKVVVRKVMLLVGWGLILLVVGLVMCGISGVGWVGWMLLWKLLIENNVSLVVCGVVGWMV